MTRRKHINLLIGTTCAGLIVAHALAQSPEYRMDESGNWVLVSTPAAGSDEAVIAVARKDLAEDRPADARRVISEWIERNDRTRNPRMAEALLIRGDAQTAEGEEYEALYDYERLIKEFPATPSFVTAIERELDIGVRYCAGLRRKFLGVRVLDAADIGEELLIRVQERMPASRLAERAGIELADYYYRERNLDLAVDAYDLFIQNYPKSQYLQRAMQRRIYATIGRFKGPRYDGSALIDAKILTRRYAALYPAEAQQAGLDDGLLTRLDESSAEELMESATWYLRRDDDVSARYILKRLIREHPKTSAAQKALGMFEERGWALSSPAKKSAADDASKQEMPAPARVEPDPKSAAPGAENAKPDERPPPVTPRRVRTDPDAPKAEPSPAPGSTPSTPPTPPTPATEPTKP
ncbi:MAG: outer membrane protein assembly factor BamD [Phycisphaerales bacterium]|nr:outer membrane protein assembly factor BamD [Phycisphaerales bacterium]